MNRKATIARETKETIINASITLEGSGKSDCKIDIPFFVHMLEQLSKHSLIDIQISAKGDLEIDAHHTVEDCGIVIGQALCKALGDKSKISRFAHCYAPLDESLSRCVLDISGRPGLFYNVDFVRSHVGDFDLDLIKEFFQALVNHIPATLHIDSLSGDNAHHIAESIFKAFAITLRGAIAIDKSKTDIPSTKGLL